MGKYSFYLFKMPVGIPIKFFRVWDVENFYKIKSGLVQRGSVGYMFSSENPSSFY